MFVLHVVPFRDALLSERHHAATEASEGEAWVETEARHRLNEVVRELGKREVSVQTLTRVGNPAAEILHAEKELDVDLVVMATHGRTGVVRLALGSVAEDVVRSSVCPVLTTRPEERSQRHA
jgi:nucleotide-binding universal stress UspA family protein